MVFAKADKSHTDRDVASAQHEIRRLARDGNASQPEGTSSISLGLSIVGKIIGQGALTIFGRVEGEVRASTVVITEGAQMLRKNFSARICRDTPSTRTRSATGSFHIFGSHLFERGSATVGVEVTALFQRICVSGATGVSHRCVTAQR
jgi:hypothetical protein